MDNIGKMAKNYVAILEQLKNIKFQKPIQKQIGIPFFLEKNHWMKGLCLFVKR